MLRIYNTLSGKKEAVKLKNKKTVQLFVCGPTVYDYAHLGHARTYIAFDVIAKYLKEKWFDVFYLQNITDIDDKIIQRAEERFTTPEKLAKEFEKEYLQDMKSLRVDSVTKYARATDHIKEIIGQIKTLQEKGFAYQIADGVYYDIAKFKKYGKLARRTVLQAEDGISRIDESKEKRNKGDFCLWKISKPGEPKWLSPWGEGRPGWHIEDTAIAQKFFGAQYDIHGGAKDLIFPHHEAEIAQMEAISGKSPMVEYWIHTGFLTVDGKKMSKSLGNFITVQDFIKQHSRPAELGEARPDGAAARILRLLIVKNYYRSPIDYSEASVTQAKKELAKIDEFIAKIQNPNSKSQIKSKSQILKYNRAFEQAMEDDFNTPKAIAVIFELMKEREINSADALKFFKKIDNFLGFIFWPKVKEKISQDLLDLVKQREQCRKEQKWQEADEIRKKITELGWQIEDTKDGSKLKRLSA